MYKINIISETSPEGLEKHKKSWEVLVEKCENTSPVQTFGWIYAFMQYKIVSRFQWICLFAYRNGELAGVYPLICLQRTGIPGLHFQFFQLPHDPFHTVRSDGLILPGNDNILEHFFSYLKDSFKALPVLWAQGIPGLSPTNRYFYLSGKKLRYFQKSVAPEDIIYLSKDFQYYVENLNPKFRREILRQERRLKEKGHVTYRFRDMERTNSFNMELFNEIENSGWKGKKKTSIIGNPGDVELFSSSTHFFNENGWMQWNFLEINNETIAAQLAVKINRVIYLWKIGYREEYSSFAPGNLLMFRFIEDAYQQGDVEEINFMNERGWLKEWKVTKRELYNTAVFPGIPLISPVLKFYYWMKYRRKGGITH